MLDVIPRFIHDMVVNRIRKGRIEATTVFIDISGFTPMSEKLYRFGKEGSEVLSEVLNDTFQPIVEKIHSSGGFVASFPGDAISAIFPSKQMNELEPLVEMIQNQFTGKARSTRFGAFSITVRIGVSQGLVSWGIVGKARRKAFFFRGKALVDSAGATAACAPGETVFVHNSSIQEKSTGDFYRIPDKDVNESVEISARIAGYFTHRRVLGIGELNGEFREVVPVFISFREVNSFQELNEFTSTLLNSAAGFGGYFNGLFFDDKGATALVLFGAPVAYENNIERAIEFILSVREDTRWDVRAGITKGIAFTGALGSKLRHTYTAIGDVVNTAARLAGKASWNQILLSAEVLRGLDIEYQTIALEPMFLKGKKKAVDVFELAGCRRGVSRNFISDKFVGRYQELKRAADFIGLTLENKTGVVLYAYGDLGTGKSRYLFELSEKLSYSFRTIILKTDDVLRKSLNPFTSYLRKFFNQGDSRTRNENKVVFEEIWEELIEDLLEIEDTAASDVVVESLENLHSVIGAMLGFHWGGSFYETLDAAGRFENTLSALKDLFIAFSLLHPTIIIIEDLQWLDSDSGKAFEVILRSLRDYPLIIMVSSRFNDDGSKPILDIEESVPCMEIMLDSLADEFSLELITNLIGNPTEDELSKFIISRAQGNPFYLEQFCLYLMENDIICYASGVASLVRMDREIPAGIKTVIIARLDRLPEALRELVHSASVLGQEFDSEVLSEMHDFKGTLSLLSAGERELIWTSSPADSLYSFRHPLLRDASY
ncbi:MAG: adenylate/guanylate cyclase domain-containing protein, partial [Candidatus Fermentibacteria bacterium]|nr:adenylate/guanylate cyclase domain-containing protein [Candidatus Fermentibacteria bacterium]